MQQRVTVIAVEGSQAWVEARRASACGDCAGRASCSTMGSWSQRFARLRVPNRLHARVGDEVVLEVPDAMLLRVAFRLYGWPMLAFIAVGLLGRQLAVALSASQPELWAALAGLGGVLATYTGFLMRPTHGSDMDARMLRIERTAPSIPIRPV